MNTSSDHRTSRQFAFTLIELLVVVAIIALLATLIFPVVSSLERAKVRKLTMTEANQIESVIELYKSKLGFYPPDNPTAYTNAEALSPLYFELAGTILNTTNSLYETLNGKHRINAADVQKSFGISGFQNSSTSRDGTDERPGPQDFTQTLRTETLPAAGAAPVLVSTAGPRWNYVSSSPTNNPASFDLWVDVNIGGDVNRISNWSPKPQVLK